MNTTKKLICMLTAGATLVLAAPVFADSGRDGWREFNRDHRQYSNYDHRYYSNYDRHGYRYYNRGYDRRHVVVVQRPVFVGRPAYYAEPAPVVYGIGPGAVLGAVIGGIIDNRY
jgi:hypothetical protein